MARSTPDQLSLFAPPTLTAPDNAISSQGSAAGRSPSPDGPPSGKSGPPRSPASRFRKRARAAASTTKDIFGPASEASLASAGLQQSLENRLRARLAGRGSPLYALTWKPLAMPWGPPLCQLAASALRTVDTGYSGWPTASSTDVLDVTAQLAAWPTPCTPSGGRSTAVEKMDATGRTTDGRKHTASLEHAVKFADLGPTLSGSTVGTKSGAQLGQLSPLFSCWLMGFGIEWLMCAQNGLRKP